MMMLIALAAAAAAQPPLATDEQRVAVSYADLDLANRIGATTLRRRVAGAATTICSAGEVETFPRTLDLAGCQQAIVVKVRPQVEAAIARAKGPRGSVSVDSAAILFRLP